MSRKLIYVDVDGVLNAEARSELRVVEMGFPLNLNPAHGTWLLSLAERTGASLVWGTTWQELANKHIAGHLGLPELPWLDLSSRKFSETNDVVKSREAENYAEDDPFVYFDDWPTIGMFITKPKGKYIYVDPVRGLQQGHIDQAEEWLNSW
jgi:HAD domain in Swiss Army Knife RNA repair proteins